MSTKHFKLECLLGKGSFGAVYKARRRSDGFVYAIKESNITNLNRRERQDAVNEIRILASIKHRNIVRYCEAFVEKDKLYIVMEFAERGDLYRQIKKYKNARKLMKEDLIWVYLYQICEGLQELHRKRIMHRDLKPKNIFLTGEHHIRIGDLGCSKLMRNGLARTQIGTPYYMSPEIWSKRPYDHKSDVWALGCILYEMCAQQPPFLASDMPSLAHKVKTHRLPRIPSAYSSDLSNLIANMLSKSASSRPTIEQILSMSIVREKAKLVPAGDEEGPWPHEPEARMLRTIKVPHGLGKKRAAASELSLPSPNYPKPRPRSSPAKMKRVSEPSSSSAVAPPPAPAAGAGAAGRPPAPTSRKQAGSSVPKTPRAMSTPVKRRPPASPVKASPPANAPTRLKAGRAGAPKPRTPPKASVRGRSENAHVASRRRGTRTPPGGVKKLDMAKVKEAAARPRGRVIVTARAASHSRRGSGKENSGRGRRGSDVAKLAVAAAKGALRPKTPPKRGRAPRRHVPTRLY